jgi:integrase
VSAKDPARKMRELAARRGLRVTKRGEVYSLHDGREVVCTGSESDADQYLRNAGRLHSPYTLPPDWQQAVDDWVGWLRLKGMAPRSIRLRYDLVRATARRLDIARPADVTLGDLERYCASNDWSREMRRSVRTSLVSFFDWCVSHGLLSNNPAAGLPTVMQESPKPRPCPDDLWRQLIETAPPRELLMIRLAGEAGLRRGEVARFHTDDLIGHPGSYSLRIVGKGSKQRVVPITDSLADAIRAHCASGFLFPGDDSGHLSPAYLGTMVSALKPPGWSMHKLRTMYGTRAFRGSRNIMAVKMLLGHASVNTTMIYLAVDDDEVRAAAVAASVGLFGIGA